MKKQNNKKTARKSTAKKNTKLSSLKQVNGKEDPIQKAKDLEELVGIKQVNPLLSDWTDLKSRRERILLQLQLIYHCRSSRCY